MQHMGTGVWHATAESISHEDLTTILEEHGSFAKADRMFEAIETGEEPEGFTTVNVEELYRRFG